MTRYRTHIILFGALLIFWFILSGRLDPVFIAIGVVSAAAVTLMAADLVRRAITDPLGGGDPAKLPTPFRSPWDMVREAFWFVVYLVWLLGKMVVANFQVAYVVLHPKLPIKPAFVRFKTSLRSHVARATLAHSITLTPGTITVDVDGDTYVVHALFPAGADLVLKGEMQRRIARFVRESDEPTDIQWEPRKEVES